MLELLADILATTCGGSYRRARWLLVSHHWEALDPAALAPSAAEPPGDRMAVLGAGYAALGEPCGPLPLDLAQRPLGECELLYLMRGWGRAITL